MKMPRPSGPVRRVVKILVAALMLAAVTAAMPTSNPPNALPDEMALCMAR